MSIDFVFKIRRRAIPGLCLLLLAISISSQAVAAQRVVAESPGGHNAVVAVDFSQLRGSSFYEPALAWALNHPGLGPRLESLKDRFDIDVRSDIEALILLTDAPPLSVELLANPVDALMAGEGSKGFVGTTLLVRGDFSADEMVETVQYHDLYQIDAKTIALVTGPQEYRNRVQERMDARSGPGARFMDAFAKLGSPQGIYLMVSPQLEKGAEEMGVDAVFAAIGVELGAEVRLGLLLTMSDEGSAESSAADMERIRSDAMANPLLSVLGLRPAVENLSIQHQGTDIQIRTSMTNEEVQALLINALRIAATSQDLKTPLSGGALDSGDASPYPSEVPHEGVQADFN